MKEFIIEMAVTILAKAIKAKPESKLARILLDDKVKNTVQDLYKYYLMIELQTEETEETEENER